MRNRQEIRIELQDTEWPFEYTDHDRRIVRAIVTDCKGSFYFVRVLRNDAFGNAKLIETSGGGVEPGEDLCDAIRRELKEELGADVDILAKIGVVSDYYNLIHRHNINNYYLCKVRSFGEKHLTQDEIEDFHLSTLKLSYEEAVEEYERRSDTRLGRLLANRELPVLKRAKELLEETEKSVIRCYGDSNTYGYDPGGFFGDSYPDPWPEIIAKETGLTVINDGMNGRTVPNSGQEVQRFKKYREGKMGDILIVALGTNDLLGGLSAGEIAKRMEMFLSECGAEKILLIAPPHLRPGDWVSGGRIIAESEKLADEYQSLAEKAGIGFADAGKWNVAIDCDGVHFTEEGHVRYAQGVIKALDSLLWQTD